VRTTFFAAKNIFKREGDKKVTSERGEDVGKWYRKVNMMEILCTDV
jgi:hypothetical protein